ncbi:hypothetical protein HMPREF0724_13241 [Prescottella equi ATCC 33707]|uniref:Uncharacterized protein n=1 Tax=Prescottella equi ATCC 33707 TaxID=525370 RepID=E9T3K0_RHOHA|nr:hypothetical protein HMPREF0724_13241 [Prescottella equi ATCC 33707]
MRGRRFGVSSSATSTAFLDFVTRFRSMARQGWETASGVV